MPVKSAPPDDLNASLRRISRFVTGTVLTALVLLIGGVGYFLIDPRGVGEIFGLGAGRIAPAADMDGVRLRLLLAILPGLILFAAIAYYTQRLFQRFRRGAILDFENARQLSIIGWLLFAAAEVSILTRTFVGLALTLSNPPGQRQFVVALSFNDFVILLFGLFVLAFGRVIREAARLSEENRGFV